MPSLVPSLSRRAIITDISDPFSPPLPIIHCFWQIFRVTSNICTELLYVCSSWTSCLYSSPWRVPREYITYELVPTSPAVSRMSGSSNSDSLHNGWLVTVQLLFCGVLSPGPVQYCLQHSCVITIKFFLHTSSWCIHIAVSILLLLGRNYASFNRSGLTSIRPIADR